MSLSGVSQRFAMHVLMKECQQDKVGALGAGLALIEARRDAIEHALEVVEGGSTVGKGQVPARVVIHFGGVVQGVAPVQGRGFLAPVPQDPSFLKPRHVPHFP